MALSRVIGAIGLIFIMYAIVVLMKHFTSVCQATKPLLDLPIENLEGERFAAAEKSYFDNLRSTLHQGYQKYKDGFYQIFSPTGYLVIASANFIAELSQLPHGTLDFHAASQRRLVGDYNWLQIADELLAHTIRNNFTRNLNQLLPAIYEEVEYCISTELPRCKEWEIVPLQEITPRLIAIVMGVVIVGPHLNRDEEWVESVTQFVADVYVGGLKLKGYHRFIRPLAARFFVPEIRRVWRHQELARRKILPLLGSEVKSQLPTRPILLRWLLDNNAKQPRPRTLDQLTQTISVAYVGSTNTVATTLTNLLLDIAARPGDSDLLQEEFEGIKRGLRLGKPDLSITSTSRLDSYMKESQRLNPAHLLTFSRIVRQTFTLSNGLNIPAGTHLIVPASMISLDEDVYESAMEFKGFRFSDARAEKVDSKHKHQFTTTSQQEMHFGYGRNACPGRFLASAVLKVFATTFLTNFDLALAGERPRNRALGARNCPPSSTRVLLRRKQQ